uniref:Uncharacterized protein n=1 Tax=Daphnia galeata TaxID=27404 RepID=A0A8J2RNQ9_9CRUS|nr:unnamed protein product [Daphnia galeata]
MKFVVSWVVAVACTMAAPQTNTAAKSVSNYSDGIVKRSSASTLENQFGQNPVTRKRRVNVFDANGKLMDFDDDDLQIVPTDFSGRQVAFQPESRVPMRSSNFVTSASSGQANSDFIFIDDDSRETEDHDDLDDDDLAIISPKRLNSFPFVNRLNAAFIPQSSMFNPSTSFVRTPFRQTRMKPKFVQSTSSCTCPPQVSTRFPQTVSQTRGFLPFMRRFPSFPSFPSVQFFLDD